MGTEIDNRIARQICADRLPQYPYAQCQSAVSAIQDPAKEATLIHLFRRICGGSFQDKKTGKQYNKNSPEVAGCMMGQMRQLARKALAQAQSRSSATPSLPPPALPPTTPLQECLLLAELGLTKLVGNNEVGEYQKVPLKSFHFTHSGQRQHFEGIELRYQIVPQNGQYSFRYQFFRNDSSLGEEQNILFAKEQVGAIGVCLRGKTLTLEITEQR